MERSNRQANDVHTQTVTTYRPFIDYYEANKISPVAQDISDLRKHYERRDSLYRSLGIPPRYIGGRDVLEFGPGSGHNSIHTLSLAPRRYLLVDGNTRGVEDTRSLLRRTYPDATGCEVVHALIDDFDSAERFDLVLAEGLVPFQMEPDKFIRKIGKFVAPGGILVLTCVDAATFMGEIGRRLIAQRLLRPGQSERERVDQLVPIFAPHLATLRDMTRSVDDWIYDNITIPIVGRTFGIDEAIVALDGEFTFYGSSPDFVLDLRWFKQLYGDERRFNERAAAAYRANMLNFIDYRVTLPANEPDLGAEIADLCRTIWREMQSIEASGGKRNPAETGPLIRTLAKMAKPSARTHAALEELANVLEIDELGDINEHLVEFASYFGRGLQHVSFVRSAV